MSPGWATPGAMSSFDIPFLSDGSFDLLPLDVTATSHHHGDGRHNHSDDCVPPAHSSHAFGDNQSPFLNPHATYHRIPNASHDDNCLDGNNCFVTGSVATNLSSQANSMQLRRRGPLTQPPSLTPDRQIQHGSVEEDEQSVADQTCDSWCRLDGATCAEDCKEPCEPPCVINSVCGKLWPISRGTKAQLYYRVGLVLICHS